MENCVVIAKNTETRPGISYIIQTKKDQIYTCHIRGTLLEGDYAKLICESTNGDVIDIGNYVFTANITGEYKINIKSNTPSLIISLIFNNSVSNNFFVDYFIILNDKKIINNATNIKAKIDTTIKQINGVSMLHIYEKLKMIENTKIIIIDEKNLEHIENCFKNYFIMVITESPKKHIYLDPSYKKITISESFKNLFFDLMSGDAYYIKI